MYFGKQLSFATNMNEFWKNKTPGAKALNFKYVLIL